MSDQLVEIGEEALPSVNKAGDGEVVRDFPETLVTEKIIFCVDILLTTKEDDSVVNLLKLLYSFFHLKNKLSVKPPEFEFLLLVNNNKIISSIINCKKDIHSALKYFDSVSYTEEKEPVQIDEVLNTIAVKVNFPDIESQENIPPDYCYHVVWLFGRNLFLPTMTTTNSFDFLMMSPYFALDILYIYDNTIKDNCCREIAHALLGLNENGSGYFTHSKYNDIHNIYSCMSQFLGHPLFRSPQVKSKFNIFELGRKVDNTTEESEE